MANYLAQPDGDGPFPAVVVLPEWWGVNEQIKAVADRWAAAGFAAVVVDVYDGKVATTSEQAERLMQELDFARAVKTIASTIADTRQRARDGKVAVTGYCMGGALAFATATQVRGLAAVVPFYGLPPGGDWARVDAPVQAHFARHDDWATVEKAGSIKAALGERMELFVYDAEHAFCNERRPEVYSPSACAEAWARTLEFVRTHTA